MRSISLRVLFEKVPFAVLPDSTAQSRQTVHLQISSPCTGTYTGKRATKAMRSENMQGKIKISRKFRLSENGFVKLIQSLSTITTVKSHCWCLTIREKAF